MNKILRASPLLYLLFFCGCIPKNIQENNIFANASEKANAAADEAMYKPVEYVNKAVRGPTLVVIPGNFKGCSEFFKTKVSPNNIADYGELELSNANFKVLERSDLGPMLDELTMAVNLGNPDALKQFQKGKFKSTKWYVKFDILNAEPVANASSGFDAKVAGNILGILTKSRALGKAVGSVNTQEESGIWVVGLRYKVIDASTSEQVVTRYFEKKMEVGSDAVSILGYSQSLKDGLTLDTVVHRLIQEAVMDIDLLKKNSTPGRKVIATIQETLNNNGYNAGVSDGLFGPKTQSALLQFQEEHGLTTTGKIDDVTLLKLKELQE